MSAGLCPVPIHAAADAALAAYGLCHMLRTYHFVGLALRQHQPAEGGQHLVLRGNPGYKQLVLIGGQQACQLAETGMLQQLTHNRRIDLVRVEISCSLHRQPQLTDIVMLAIRYVGVTQQEVGGHVEVLSNLLQAGIRQLVRFAAHKAAERAFIDANGMGQLRLLQIFNATQVADSIPDVAGKPVLRHIIASFLCREVIPYLSDIFDSVTATCMAWSFLRCSRRLYSAVPMVSNAVAASGC